MRAGKDVPKPQGLPGVLIWRVFCQVGVVDLPHFVLFVLGVVGWVGGGLAGCARRAVRLIFAGLGYRRTMVRRGEPVLKTGGVGPLGGGFSHGPVAVPPRVPGPPRPKPTG